MLSSNKKNATHNYVEKHNSLGRCSVSRYVYMYSHHIQQEKDQPGKVANLGIIGCKYKTSCLLLFLTSSVLVANPKNTTFILHVTNPARGLLNMGGKREENNKCDSAPPPPPTLLVCFVD